MNFKKKYSVQCFSTCVMVTVLSFSGLVKAQVPQAFKGQGEIKKVSTLSRPVQYQKRGVTVPDGDDVSFDNRFAGAALHGVKKLDDNIYEVSILPENTPINQSPWYAFKVWSKKTKIITIRLKYPDQIYNRQNQITKN